jgi:ABC-type multidrug transport system ATPase subunit
LRQTQSKDPEEFHPASTVSTLGRESLETCQLASWNMSIPSTEKIAADLRSVSKLFGAFHAVRNLTVALPAGSATVILGENGAGKSTLLRLLAGLTLPTQGTLAVLGGDPTQRRGRIAYMSHAPMLYDELSALENLTYFAALHTSPCGLCACSAGSPEMALRAVGLDPALSRPVGQYSQGMRQRASLARVLQTDPELLLLDEPFSNLDVASAHQMVALLADFLTWPHPNGPRTLVLTTHQAHLAAPLATQTLTMRQGTLATLTSRTIAPSLEPPQISSS